MQQVLVVWLAETRMQMQFGVSSVVIVVWSWPSAGGRSIHNTTESRRQGATAGVGTLNANVLIYLEWHMCMACQKVLLSQRMSIL